MRRRKLLSEFLIYSTAYWLLKAFNAATGKQSLKVSNLHSHCAVTALGKLGTAVLLAHYDSDACSSYCVSGGAAVSTRSFWQDLQPLQWQLPCSRSTAVGTSALH
jgi:hypothetical protein